MMDGLPEVAGDGVTYGAGGERAPPDPLVSGITSVYNISGLQEMQRRLPLQHPGGSSQGQEHDHQIGFDYKVDEQSMHQADRGGTEGNFAITSCHCN